MKTKLKENIFLGRVIVIILLLAVVYLHFYERYNPKEFSVVLAKDGYKPTQIKIRKGDLIKFTTTENSAFWPASDPHPEHTQYSYFDPKKATKNTDSWEVRLYRPGLWAYHDHLNPGKTGVIKVLETNPLFIIFEKVDYFYKHYLQKHDLNFIQQISEGCRKIDKEDQLVYVTCWTDLYTRLIKDLGVSQVIHLISIASESDMLTTDECHRIVSQIGVEAYWQYISGNKFEIDQEYAVCDKGFFHHFMSEHVSHGQDFIGSAHFCESLRKNLDEAAIEQCYLGAGDGLAFYYWGILGNDVENIAKESLKKCDEMNTYQRQCVRGVYSGVDHLLQGTHGSDLKPDSNDPFSLCKWQKIPDYKTSCYERMVPTLAVSSIENGIRNLPKINFWLNKITDRDSRKEAAIRFGIILSENENDKKIPDFNSSISDCRELDDNLVSDCIYGVIYGIYTDFRHPETIVGDSDCVALTLLSYNEKKICSDITKYFSSL